MPAGWHRLNSEYLMQWGRSDSDTIRLHVLGGIVMVAAQADGMSMLTMIPQDGDAHFNVLQRHGRTVEWMAVTRSPTF